MSYFQNTAMTVSLLTRGWLVRIFILILWLLAIIWTFLVPEEKTAFGPMLVIGVANFFLYITVSSRLIVLVHNSMSGLLANYFDSIKKSLLIILLISLVPTLILITYPVYWLSLLSLSIFMAVLAVTMTYRPIVYWLFLSMAFIPYSVDNVSNYFSNVNFPLLLAYALPIIALFAYYLLTRLESYKGNTKHVEKMLNLMNLSMKISAVMQDDLPLKSRNKFMQWLVNTNYQQYRLLINNGKNMSNSQLIATTCQSASSINRYTYIFWLMMTVLVALIAHFLSHEYVRFIIPFSIIFPAMIIGAGTLVIFQVINKKKSLLKRLAITPSFAPKHSFCRAFVFYILANQVKLYVFLSLVVAILVNSLEYISWGMYSNILLTLILLCFFNLSLMMWSWSSKQAYEGLVIWLMLIAFTVCIVFLMVVNSDANIQLIESTIFTCFFLVGIVFFGLSVYRSYQRLPHFSLNT